VPHIYREKGCPSCLESGFKGRSGVFELMVLNDEIKDLLVGRPSILAIKKVAKKFGMRTLQEDGMRKVIAGITSINEVHRVAGS
jgi:type II secretory ATPase GspE/PulE/Tfp pilus assembly ATPase PilB-like protein